MKLYIGDLLKSVEKVQVWLKWDNVWGTSRADTSALCVADSDTCRSIMRDETDCWVSMATILV